MPASSNDAISFEMDPVQLAKFRKQVERWQGLPLKARISKGTLKAADYLVRPVRAFTPVMSGRHANQAIKRSRPGDLRRSVKAKPARKNIQAGITGAIVGPNAPHAHLVIRGTNPHSLGNVRDGRSLYSVLPDSSVRRTTALHHLGSRPNPFVDKAAEAHGGDAFRVVSDILFGQG